MSCVGVKKKKERDFRNCVEKNFFRFENEKLYYIALRIISFFPFEQNSKSWMNGLTIIKREKVVVSEI